MNVLNITDLDGNNQSNFSCNFIHRDAAKITEAIVCALIFLTSLFGNAFIIIVVYRERRMRTIVNFLIVNMAVSDLLCTVVVVPRVVSQIYSYQSAWLVTGTVGNALCKISFFAQDATVAVSLLSLLLIAIERYCAITQPLVAANPIPPWRCRIMISSTWLVASLMYSTHFYTFKLPMDTERTVCLSTWEPLIADTSKAWEIQFLLHTIVFVFIPFIVVISLYSSILIRISHSRIPGDKGSITRDQRKARERRNRSVLRMLLAVMIAFGVCWFPFIIYTCVAAYSNLDPSCGLLITKQCTLFLAYLNSSLNPAIYFAFSENYRRGLKRLFSLVCNSQWSKNVVLWFKPGFLITD